MSVSTHPISSLRQRMLKDTRMRKFSNKTQSQYIRAVGRFTGYHGRPNFARLWRMLVLQSCNSPNSRA